MKNNLKECQLFWWQGSNTMSYRTEQELVDLVKKGLLKGYTIIG